ncbi:substrate-binding domain-containing protein [Leifsonia sp. fls2-241-R2A-40a]|uniref:substrate-binding domain-containing protein n=1 Tax=Leifsonia sp. fls2-241-R2A-40a TaxID=3040290 RepID=UPI00254AFA69|nr:substrate-binding domain-containing protein [Leifsonia sp. fls2-241-R2A-40a]
MTDTAASIGLVIRHGRDRDPVASAIVRAIAGPLLAAGMRFITRSVDDEDSELRTYRLWARVGGIAGVIVLGAVEADARIRLLRQIDMPFVALAPAVAEPDFPAVTVDAAAASRALAAYLAAHPARRWVYVTGKLTPEPLVSEAGSGERTIETVQTPDVVGAAVRIGEESSSENPTALVFDSDHDAVAALEALEERGVPVPAAVSLICWSDSLVCQSASRPITAIDRHGREIGSLLGTAALAAIHDDDFRPVAAPEPVVVVRETT